MTNINYINKMTRNFNNYDVLKSIAFLTMVIDHIGYYFFPQTFFIRAIGRASAIIFALLFGITKHKKNNRVLLYAFLTSAVLCFFGDGILPLNILYNFYLSYFLIDYLEDLYYNSNFIFNIILILLIPLSFITNIFIEYGLIFLFLVFCGRLFSKENKTKKDKTTVITIFIMYFLYQILNFGFGIINSLIVAIMFYFIFKNMYNFKIVEVKKNKLLFFMSRYSLQLYTIHLLILNILLRWLY